MTDQPKISVIIPFADSSEKLFNCLDALYDNQNKIRFETIIVQSGSKESIAEQLKNYDDLILIHSEELFYPGKARNIGVQNTKSNILAFLDADCLPCVDWVDIGLSSILQGWNIVLGPILNENISQPIASVDNLLQFVDFQKTRPSKNISHFPGTNFIITRKLFQKAGGFRDDLKAGEDVIFSQQAIKLVEGKILFNKNLIVKHVGRNTFAGFINHQKSFGYYRGLLSLKINSLKIFQRNYALYAAYFGLKRFIYIYTRTFQWNPKAVPMLIFYFPLIILGLSYWSIGFFKGVKTAKEKQSVS